ncbi:hypothetical protein F2Q69_00030571 [Brassica cretica]|uniref:Uncharacterized protein n=1 Tax=Brassica cretica TaxID=69181 RepID=A0A8S9S3A1_BRACR|nr:hypothetical protein F2Q69_00030571 [Brassica cretica]
MDKGLQSLSSAATEGAKVPLQKSLADLTRPSQFYTNRSAIQPLQIQRFEICPHTLLSCGSAPLSLSS